MHDPDTDPFLFEHIKSWPPNHIYICSFLGEMMLHSYTYDIYLLSDWQHICVGWNFTCTTDFLCDIMHTMCWLSWVWIMLWLTPSLIFTMTASRAPSSNLLPAFFSPSKLTSLRFARSPFIRWPSSESKDLVVCEQHIEADLTENFNNTVNGCLHSTAGTFGLSHWDAVTRNIDHTINQSFVIDFYITVSVVWFFRVMMVAEEKICKQYTSQHKVAKI